MEGTWFVVVLLPPAYFLNNLDYPIAERVNPGRSVARARGLANPGSDPVLSFRQNLGCQQPEAPIRPFTQHLSHVAPLNPGFLVRDLSILTLRFFNLETSTSLYFITATVPMPPPR
jgi:hypothetical protein